MICLSQRGLSHVAQEKKESHHFILMMRNKVASTDLDDMIMIDQTPIPSPTTLCFPLKRKKKEHQCPILNSGHETSNTGYDSYSQWRAAAPYSDF